MTNSNKEHVRNIIAQTFKVIKKVYDTQKEEFGNSSEFCESGSRIIFPKYSGRYRNGVTRISEQELRFIFVEQFNKYCKKKLVECLLFCGNPNRREIYF